MRRAVKREGRRIVLFAALVMIYACSITSCAQDGRGLDAEGKPLGLSAKTPTASPAGSAVPTFSYLRGQYFTPRCAVAGCHTGSGQAGLVWDAADIYTQIFNVNSAEQAAVKRVKPNDPDNSYVIQKLEGASTIFGQRMPANAPAQANFLTTAEIAEIRAWINAGAANN